MALRGGRFAYWPSALIKLLIDLVLKLVAHGVDCAEVGTIALHAFSPTDAFELSSGAGSALLDVFDDLFGGGARECRASLVRVAVYHKK